jgi:hypothetical protein
MQRHDKHASSAAAPPVPPERYGLCLGFRINTRTSGEQDTEIGIAAALGCKIIRIDRPTSTVISKLWAAGIEPYYLLRGDTPTPGAIGTTATFAADCAAKVTAAGPNVRYFEVMNEPDLHGWTATTYLPYLQAAYAAIKAANSNAIVVHGGLWKGGTGPIQWMKDLYVAGGQPYFDVMNIHCYDDPAEHGSWSLWDYTWGSNGAGFYDSENVRSVMNANGDSGKAIVSTEAGGPLFLSDGVTPKYTQAKQATIVTNALQAADGVGLANRRTQFTMVYSLYDDDGGTIPDAYALIGPDYVTHRLSYAAYQAVATA